jgi:hypothetical protein
LFCRFQMLNTKMQCLFIQSSGTVALSWSQCINHITVLEGKLVKRTFNWSNQQDAATSKVYYLSFNPYPANVENMVSS